MQTSAEFYRIQVPINGRQWRTVASFACTTKAQDYARTLVNFRVLRASPTGWELVVCHTAASDDA